MQDTNLNVTPYFDDYQREKEFYKVLFKPGYPVQSRELTTLQSILQNQVERFGQHIFKDGSMVIPGQIAFDLNYKVVTIQSLVNGVEVESYRTGLVGQKLTGSISGVTALILYTIGADESDKGVITLYVKYITGGNFDINGNQYTKFIDNENLIDTNLSVIATTSLTNSTSYTGSVASIASGVYFSRGYFLEVNSQSIILDQYNNSPSYKIGLKLSETIVSASDDESLKDNSLSYSNFSAPGADRLKISAELVKIGLEEEQDKNFIELLRLREGIVEYKIDRSTYAELGKNIARRTYEESGNYSVTPFKLTKKETLNNLFNNGTYELNSSSQYSGKTVVNGTPTTNEEFNANDYFTVEICPGKAYVKGYEVETVSHNFIDFEKSRTTLSKNNEGSLVSHGNYFELETANLKGSLPSGSFTNIFFFDKTIGSSNENLVGRAKYYSLVYESKIRLYLVDFSTLTNITYNNTGGINFAVQFDDVVTGSISGATGIVYVTPSSNTIQLQQVSGNFVVGETVTNSRNSVSVTLTNVIDYTTERVRSVSTESTLSAPTPVFSANISLDTISITGSSFVVSGGTTLTGVNTSFLTELFSNSTLKFGNTTTTVSSISTNSTAVLSSSVSNQSYTSAYKLVATLKTSGSQHFSLPQNKNISQITDVSFSIVKTYNVTFTNGSGILTPGTGETVSGSVLIQTSTTSMTGTLGSTNIITCSDSGFSGNATVFAKVLISTPTVKQKSLTTCAVLKVDKSKSTLNTYYGTRKEDVEISLVKPDVIRIHAIRQATSTSYTNNELFDSVVVTNATNFNVGDIVYSTQNTAKAKIVSKSSNILYLVYYNTSVFSSSTGSNQLKNFTTDAETTVTTVNFGTYVDITNVYDLDKNIGDDIYDISKLVRKNGYAAPQYDFVVVYDYYSHGSGDYFNISSYPLNQISYENIGYYGDISLSDIIDFRLTASQSAISTTGTGSLTSPLVVTSNSLSKLTRNLISKNLAYPGTTTVYDYSYYVGRIDTLVFDENGKFQVIKGTPSTSPKYPQVLDDSLKVASFVIPPYVMDVNDIYVQQYDNRRYTMSDIGLLDRRLSNVEYYTSLNLLEVDTNTLTITDENGFNRFKNGFVVDSFQDFTVSDLTNNDYKSSVDVNNKQLRPSHYTNNVDLEFKSTTSTNYKKTGSLLTLNYTDDVYVDQPFASKAENVNPFNVFSWVGRIDLTPGADNWVSTTRQADNIIRVEGNFEQTARQLGANAQGVTPTQWGAWQTISSSTSNNWWSITTTTNQRRTGTFNVLVENWTENSLGDTVLSSTTSLYMRERTIGISATRLKPNNRLYLFLNNTNMTNYTISTLIEIYKGGENGTNAREYLVGETVRFANTNITATVISPTDSGFAGNPYNQDTLPTTYTGTYSYIALSFPSIIDTPIPVSSFSENATITGVTSGAVGKFKTKQIICDRSGQWFGTVIIPDPNLNANPRFANGQTTFRLTTSSIDSRVSGIVDTDAETIFSSSGTTTVVQKNVVSVRNADVQRRTTTQDQTLVSTQQIIRWVDPLAQSFLIDRPGGAFLTKVDLYFQAKDTNIPVNIQIRTMENGIPTQTVVPFSDVTVLPSNVNISDNASVSTTFTFPSPVYLSQDQEYALVVWTNCDNYKAWIARLGETDVTTNRLISDNPYAGVLFKSQNASTWTPDQYEDLKFKMYYAKFDNSSSAELFFENKPLADSLLRKDPITMNLGSSVITVTHPNHCMHTSNNRVTISGVKSEVPNTTLVGSTLTNIQNTSVTTITLTNALNFHTKIGNADISSTNLGYLKIGNEIIAYSGISSNTVTIPVNARGINSTEIVAHSAGETVECYNLNGIPLTEINKTHTSIIPLTLDTYNLQLNIGANNTLTSGGESAFATKNIQYEHVTTNIASLAVTGTDISAKLNSITATSISSNTTLQPSYQSVTNEQISLERINDLGNPRLVASTSNQSFYNNNNQSITLNLQLSSTANNLSPVVDLDRCSLITTSNRINKLSDTSTSLLPSNTKNESNYVTKVFTLENSSTALKVLFEGVRFNTNNIRVYVKIGRDDVLNFDNTSYIELTSSSYPSSSNYSEYKEFEYEVKGLPQFKSYCVKIETDSDNQALVPLIRKFRAIALAV